eukprot:TRINITY_DN67332_c7_g2_i1.p1 TRINITY_DN67332_c7_g2~~TRINITY_DN67332_c7_g2_i1.p1  ORF type:complete len:965 (-),score=159.76 TRINITY_DN67332_c7_g2_i1:127-3021(-)
MLVSSRAKKKHVSSDIEDAIRKKEETKRKQDTDGRARKYLLQRGNFENAKVNHKEYAQRRREHAADLLNKIMVNVASTEGSKELSDSKPADMHGAFDEIALNKIRQDRKNFSSTDDFLTHIESKLQWLLKELGGTDERLQALSDRHEKLRIDHTVVAKEREDFMNRLDAMKDVLMERAATYQTATADMKKLLDSRDAEMRQLKSKMVLSAKDKKKHKGGAMMMNMPSSPPPGGGGVGLGFAARPGSPSANLLGTEMDGWSSNDFVPQGGDAHASVIKDAEAEEQMLNSELGKLKEDMAKMNVEAKLQVDNYEAQISKLRKDSHRLQKELEAERKAAANEQQQFLVDMGDQMAIQERLTKELEEKDKALTELKEHHSVVTEKLVDVQEKFIASVEANEKKITELTTYYTEMNQDKTDLFNKLTIERNKSARLLAEKEFVLEKHLQLEAKFNKTLDKLTKLKEIFITGPSAVQLLQKMEHMSMEVLKTDQTRVLLPGVNGSNGKKPLSGLNPSAAKDPSRAIVQEVLLSLIDPDNFSWIDDEIKQQVADNHRNESLPKLPHSHPKQSKAVAEQQAKLAQMKHQQAAAQRRAIKMQVAGESANLLSMDANADFPWKDVATQTGTAERVVPERYPVGTAPHEIPDIALAEFTAETMKNENAVLKKQMSSLLTQLTKFPFLQEPPTLQPQVEMLDTERHQLQMVIKEIHDNNKQLLEKNKDFQLRLQRSLERSNQDRKGFVVDKGILSDKIAALQQQLKQRDEEINCKDKELNISHDEVEALHKSIATNNSHFKALQAAQLEMDNKLHRELESEAKLSKKRLNRIEHLDAALRSLKAENKKLKRHLKKHSGGIYSSFEQWEDEQQHNKEDNTQQQTKSNLDVDEGEHAPAIGEQETSVRKSLLRVSGNFRPEMDDGGQQQQKEGPEEGQQQPEPVIDLIANNYHIVEGMKQEDECEVINEELEQVPEHE